MEAVAYFGRVLLFALRGTGAMLVPPWYGRILLNLCVEAGYYSLPVIGMTTIFSGMVLALQSYGGFSTSLASETIPVLVVLAITRELAPVLAGLMVAGRVGASMAAEIGTMRVTEQIDALETMTVSPWQYLIGPRILATTLVLPVLVLIGDVLGIAGGYLISVFQLGLNPALYIVKSWEALEFIGVVSGLVKAAFFGFIIGVMGCYQGFRAGGGALGVGRATTNAVIYSSILILVSNYFITSLFFLN